MPLFTTNKRKVLAQKGEAMSDGGFPIRNANDLKNAIQSFGRANNKPLVKKWIKKRAKDLNLENLLPDSWKDMKQSGIDDDCFSENSFMSSKVKDFATPSSITKGSSIVKALLNTKSL